MADEDTGAGVYWIRFEDVDGRALDQIRPSAVLPEVGQLLPIAGTHAEVMEQWLDRSLVAEGGPEVIVFTVRPLA